ncbi:hypothetical protein PGT21_008823 [Puccinia graminis f. sp. tritici]|uniref:Uncharacterized protein n=1 Tax=Puccinia graminis f. sp. tritici TaxID=56615 RepID=A0A5B0LL10_PUCGR|nr:hypothetical protein PGT21_008823 [Puccinia graminis f. sp. tritici]
MFGLLARSCSTSGHHDLSLRGCMYTSKSSSLESGELLEKFLSSSRSRRLCSTMIPLITFHHLPRKHRIKPGGPSNSVRLQIILSQILVRVHASSTPASSSTVKKA